MEFLDIFKVAWPIAVTLLPIILSAGILWLRSQFPTKVELEAVRADVAAKLKETEARLTGKIDAHDERLDIGSKKMAELDKRASIVEEECRQAPSRNTLQTELSSINARVRGVEAYLEGTKRELGTLNDYLHTLIERGLGGK